MKKIKILLIIGISAILLIGCNKPDKPPQYYTVNFAGEGVNIEPQTVESGNHAVAPENPDRDCYCFDGWFIDKETFTEQWDFETNVVTKDITLYVKWEEAPKWIEYVKSDLVGLGIKCYNDVVTERCTYHEAIDSIKIIISPYSMIISIGFETLMTDTKPLQINHQCEIQNDTIKMFIIDSNPAVYRQALYFSYDFFFELTGCLNYYYIAEFILPDSNRIIGKGYIYD